MQQRLKSFLDKLLGVSDLKRAVNVLALELKAQHRKLEASQRHQDALEASIKALSTFTPPQDDNLRKKPRQMDAHLG